MTDGVGNVLHLPGTSSKTAYTDDEIVASYVGFTQKGLTLLSGNGFIATGTALKLSGTPKKYQPAALADLANVVGILRKDVDTTNSDMLGNYVLHGSLKGSKIKYSDVTTGLTTAQLNSLASQLGGHYNPVHDILSY